jgi:phage terminase large subunit-like protein
VPGSSKRSQAAISANAKAPRAVLPHVDFADMELLFKIGIMLNNATCGITILLQSPRHTHMAVKLPVAYTWERRVFEFGV